MINHLTTGPQSERSQMALYYLGDGSGLAIGH